MGYVTDEIAAETAGLTQQRGREYFQRGRVREVVGDEHSIDATVLGTDRYEVELSIVEDALDYSCSCPYYLRDFDVCKHIWAAALAAEQRGLLKDLLLEGAVAPAQTARAQSSGKGGHQPALKKPPEPDWKRSLDSMRTAMDAAQWRAADSAPAEKEL